MNKEQILEVLEEKEISVSIFALYLIDEDSAYYMLCDDGSLYFNKFNEFKEYMYNIANNILKVKASFESANSIYSTEVIFQVEGNDEYFRVVGEDSSYGRTFSNRIEVVKPYNVVRTNFLTENEYRSEKVKNTRFTD